MNAHDKVVEVARSLAQTISTDAAPLRGIVAVLYELIAACPDDEAQETLLCAAQDIDSIMRVRADSAAREAEDAEIRDESIARMVRSGSTRSEIENIFGEY